MIEAVEIEIGEKLAGQVADRQATAAPEGCKEIIAVEIKVHRLLRVRAIDDQVQKRERRWASDAAAKVGFQDRMIDRRKIAVDVASQNVGVAVAITLIGLDSRCVPLPVRLAKLWSMKPASKIGSTTAQRA